jgi:hypothetical protein
MVYGKDLPAQSGWQFAPSMIISNNATKSRWKDGNRLIDFDYIDMYNRIKQQSVLLVNSAIIGKPKNHLT